MSSHCFLYSMVSNKKSAFNFIEKWFVTGCFSFVAFKILSSSLTLLHWTMICLGMTLLFYLEFIELLFKINIFHQIWKVFDQYFFKSLFCPFSSSSFHDTLIMCMLECLLLSLRSLRPCSNFSSSLSAPNTG